MEPIRPLRRGGYADPSGDADALFLHLPTTEELERRLAEVVAVEVSGDPEGLTQAPGACSERSPTSAPTHGLLALDRLDASKKDRLRLSFTSGDDVHAPVQPVATIHVRTARRAEHRPVPVRGAHHCSCM